MTVEELIEKLRQYPSETEIYVQITEDEDVEITQLVYDAELNEVIIEIE